MLLLAPFEPKPLFAVLAQQGFTHTARALDAGDWEVLFTRTSQATILLVMASFRRHPEAFRRTSALETWTT